VKPSVIKFAGIKKTLSPLSKVKSSRSLNVLSPTISNFNLVLIWQKLIGFN